MEALSPPWWRVQSTVGGSLCGLDMMRCPRTGLCKGGATPGRRASLSQARERGSPRSLPRLSPRLQEPERVSHQCPGLWDKTPMRTLAFRDAVQQDLEHACDRLIPCVASEASGSPALLPEPWRNVSRSQAAWRVSLSETARASWCARMVKAFPWPCVVSLRATYCCPAGWWRRNKTAASEKAHGRWPVPIFWPDVPHRVPAESLAHLTRHS